MEQYIIYACSGIRISICKEQKISVIDTDGGQVVDFFAQIPGDVTEVISPGVTIDCNESLRLNIGNISSLVATTVTLWNLWL